MLKSYRLMDKKGKSFKGEKTKLKSSGELVKGGVHALLGIALLSEVASAIKRI